MAVRAIHVSIWLERPLARRSLARARSTVDRSRCVVLTKSGSVDLEHSIVTSLLVPSRTAVRALREGLPSAEIRCQRVHVPLREEASASRWFVLSWGNCVFSILTSVRMRLLRGSKCCDRCGSGRSPIGPVKIDWNEQRVSRSKVVFGRDGYCLLRTEVAQKLVAFGLACRDDFTPVYRDPSGPAWGPTDRVFSLVRPRMRVPRALDLGSMTRLPTRRSGRRRTELACARCGRDGWVRGVVPTIVEGADWPSSTGCGLAGTWEELSPSWPGGLTIAAPSWPLILASSSTASFLRPIVGSDAVLAPVLRPEAVGRHRWPRDPLSALFVDHLRSSV